MSRITLDLLRKRSEHNEGEISTLEEIALHQENIEKIELIEKNCKHLKILLLQHNLVSKIENLSKLKRLEYLNLALNNIEIIENLQGLESLKKLDLTVNFIGDLRGIKTLRCNEYLEQLFLMGNPCADYQGYREYTIANLTQLKELDGTPIERSERIKALQAYPEIEGEIVRSCARHKKTREMELLDYRKVADAVENQRERKREEQEQEQEQEEEEIFWNRVSRHSPEERIAIAERFLRKQEGKNEEKEGAKETKHATTFKLKLFNSDGKPYNVNEPKVLFKLNDEQYNDCIVLEVALYRYLDTCYVHVDVQPDYVRVTIKGKILQLTLPHEVSVNGSVARRNTTNGRLLVTMPRLNPLATILPSNPSDPRNLKERMESYGTMIERRAMTSVREYLEIGPVKNHLDFSRIVLAPPAGEPFTENGEKEESPRHEGISRGHDPEADVPPLE